MLRLINAVPAVLTYVDAKAVVAGTTTSQAIPIKVGDGYISLPGLIRSVDNAQDARLPDAWCRVEDVDSPVDPLTAEVFLGKVKAQAPGSYLLHLCEGNNINALPGIVAAREHFDCLKLNTGAWALTSGFAGVHCLALNAQDFAVLASYESSIVWSPLSNYVLYGSTADIQAAKSAKILIGLGPDWSFSGSKNLFGEMKVARAVSDYLKIGFTNQEIVAMATINGAKILHWDQWLGSLKGGKLADFIVLDQATGDPYDQLISSPETSITLVALGGKALFGSQTLMKLCGVSGEAVSVGGNSRVIALPDNMASLAEATTTIRGLLNSPPEQYVPTPPPAGVPTPVRPGVPIEVAGASLHLGELGGIASVQNLEVSRVVADDTREPSLKFDPSGPVRYPNPLPLELSWRLDPLAVANDYQYFTLLEKQPNLPQAVTGAIKSLYGY